MGSLNFEVENNSGIDAARVWIGFYGALNGTVNGSPMASIAQDTWYGLSDIQSVVIDATTSGRVYVAFDSTFSAMQGFPSFIAPSDAYLVRYDKFELTFDGTQYSVADLTAIDFWGIPVSLATEKAGSPVGRLDGVRSGSSVKDIYASLEALTNPVQSRSSATAIAQAFDTAGHPLPTGIEDGLDKPASGVVRDNDGNFVRVIGPNSYPPFGDPATPTYPGLPFTPYDTFMDYFEYLAATFGPGTTPSGFTRIGDGVIAHLAGEFGGVSDGSGGATEKQSYQLEAKIDDDLNLTITGTGSVIGAIDIAIPKWDLLSPAAAYGGNATFSVSGGPPQTPKNDLYAWILGDFFSGLNIGALGSAAEVDGEVVGDMNSSGWFAKLPERGCLFDKLWPSGVVNHWNQWAAQLNSASDAYNFAYAERFSAPQLSLDPANVDTLTLILLDAAVPA